MARKLLNANKKTHLPPRRLTLGMILSGGFGLYEKAATAIEVTGASALVDQKNSRKDCSRLKCMERNKLKVSEQVSLFIYGAKHVTVVLVFVTLRRAHGILKLPSPISQIRQS